MNSQMKEHWNTIYASRELHQLGWYEDSPHPSLRLLPKCELHSDDPILDVGAGASTFIDCLIERGFRNITAADISEIGLIKLKERLGKEKASRVKWIVDDVTNATTLKDLRGIALWHDRAMLHFLVEEGQRQAYLSTLRQVLRPGGYVIVAAFSLEGARRCSGLDVRNYDEAMFIEFLGEGFGMIECLDYVYHMPSGEARPYTYICMQRKRQQGHQHNGACQNVAAADHLKPAAELVAVTEKISVKGHQLPVPGAE